MPDGTLITNLNDAWDGLAEANWSRSELSALTALGESCALFAVHLAARLKLDPAEVLDGVMSSVESHPGHQVVRAAAELAMGRAG